MCCLDTYDSTSGKERFVAEQCFLDDSEPVCFIGDLPSDGLLQEICDEVVESNIKLNMQPLQLLIRKIRDTCECQQSNAIETIHRQIFYRLWYIGTSSG
jgi:hypothetical protein